jgi:ZIP family zinc transporter
MFAAIGQSALIVGAILVYKFKALTKPKVLGLIMAFGAGAIISAVATDLVAVSYDEAGAGPTALGIAVGGLGYFLVISRLERKSESEAPTEPVERELESGDEEIHGASPTEARNLLIGMVVDGVPESVSIGLTLHTVGRAVSAALVGAVFVAGLPEAIGVAAALLAGGLTLGKILLRFSIIVLVGAVSGAIGYQALVGADPRIIAIIQSIAAGALLVVVVNEMVPIAVRGAGRLAGLLAAAGFVFSAAMTWASGG